MTRSPCPAAPPLPTPQDAERSKFVVMKAEQEKKAAVIRAEGESQAALLISNVSVWGRGAPSACSEFARVGGRASRAASGVWVRPHLTHPPHPHHQSLREAGNGAIEVKRIDAARDIAEVLSQSRNVVYVPGGGQMLMALPQIARAAPQQMQ